MEPKPQPEYSEELQPGSLTKIQYLDAAKRAAIELGWDITTEEEDILVCHTPSNTYSHGEFITIKAEGDFFTFQSKSASESTWLDQNPNEVNATLFKEALASVTGNNSDIQNKTRPRGKDILKVLIPSGEHLITPIIVYINIAVFIIMVLAGVSFIQPNTSDLLNWGGNFRPDTVTGGWWRLFTSMFLHAGIIHLLANMYALLYIGLLLEPLLGRFRYAAAYILAGICSGLMSIVVHTNVVAVGASGAIFGLYGVFLAMLTTNYIEKETRNAMLKSILLFVGYNLLYGMQGNIDNAAHIGGLISGLAIGYVYIHGVRREHDIKTQATITGIIAVCVVGLTVLTMNVVTGDLVIYQRDMKGFIANEKLAVKIYKMRTDLPREEMLHNIRDIGIYNWNENIKILNEIAKLDLPPKIKENDEILMQYCLLRISSYELLYKKISEQTDAYDDEIKQDNEKIIEMINGLKEKS